MKIWSGLWKKIVAVFATITCVASLSSIATSYSITSSVDKNNFDIQTTKRENATVDSTENKVEEKTNTLSESNNENQTNSVSNKTPSLKNTYTGHYTFYFDVPVDRVYFSSINSSLDMSWSRNLYLCWGRAPNNVSWACNDDSDWFSWNGGGGRNGSTSPGKYEFCIKVGRGGSRKDHHLEMRPMTISYGSVSYLSSSCTRSLTKGESYSIATTYKSSYGALDPLTYVYWSVTSGSSCISLSKSSEYYSSRTGSFRREYTLYNSITARNVGSATVKVTVGGQTEYLSLNISYAVIKKLTISSTSKDMHKGETFTLFCNIDNVINVDPALNQIVWEYDTTLLSSTLSSTMISKSGDNIDFTCKEITPPDTPTTIKAYVKSNPSIYQTCTVTIIYAELKNITISATQLLKDKGETFALNCELENVENIDPALNNIQWISSTTSIVVKNSTTKSGIDANFFCQEITQLTEMATITAITPNGLTAECVVDIIYPEVRSVILPDSVTVSYGGSTSITPQLIDSRYVDPDTDIYFTCGDAAISFASQSVKQNEPMYITSTSQLPQLNPITVFAYVFDRQGNRHYSEKPCKVIVEGVLPKTLSIAPSTIQASLGETFNSLHAILDNKASPTTIIEWSVSDPMILSIKGPSQMPASQDPEFEVIADSIPSESVKVFAKTEDKSGNTLTAEAYVQIKAGFPESIKIISYPSKEEGSLIKGVAGEAGNTGQYEAVHGENSYQILPATASSSAIWSLEKTDEDHPIPSWLHIHPETGTLYWDNTNTEGSYQFYVKVTARAKNKEGLPVTDRTLVSLNLQMASSKPTSVTIKSGPIDSRDIGYVGEANHSTAFQAIVDPIGSNQTVEWSIVAVDGGVWLEQPYWLSISMSGQIQWTSNAQMGSWKFRVKATTIAENIKGEKVSAVNSTDITLDIKYREPTGIEIVQTPQNAVKTIGVDGQKSFDSNFVAEVYPSNARPLCSWSIDKVEKLDKQTGHFNPIPTPEWLNIDNNGLIFWDDTPESLVEVGDYNIVVKATTMEKSRDGFYLSATSNPVRLSIIYRNATSVIFTPESIEALFDENTTAPSGQPGLLKAYFNTASNLEVMTGRTLQAIVQPEHQANPDVIWTLEKLSAAAAAINVHIGDPTAGEKPNVFYWNAPTPGSGPITFTVKVTSADKKASATQPVTLKPRYAKIEQITASQENIEVSGAVNGEIKCTTNDMASLEPDVATSNLYWTVSDPSALEILESATVRKENEEYVSTITTKGSTIQYKILKDNFFGFKYSIKCFSKEYVWSEEAGSYQLEQNIVREIFIYKPFPWWLIIVICAVGVILFGLLIWWLVKRNKKQKDKKEAKKQQKELEKVSNTIKKTKVESPKTKKQKDNLNIN